MNHFLFDLLPVLLFFIVFKYQGIYAATWVGIIVTILQSVAYRIAKKHWDKMQLATLIVFLIFGGMTLYFHNPIFVKWKPTIIFWLFALVLLGSHLIGQKPMMQRILEGALNNAQNREATTPPTHQLLLLSSQIGKRINLAWALFFIILGAINIYVAYQYSDEIWVNFKLYGITVATLIFSLLQTIFLMRYLKI